MPESTRTILRTFFFLGVVFSALLMASPASADDCTRDPLNAADCMRTPFFRPTIAVTVGVTGTLTTVLVNILLNQAMSLSSQSSLQPPVTQLPPVQLPEIQPPPIQPPPSYQPPPVPLSDGQVSIQPPVDLFPASPGQPSAQVSSWFDWAKTAVDYTGKIYSLFEKYKFTPEAIERWKIASRMWHYFPNKATAEEYINATRNRMNPGGKWGQRLDIAGKVMDGIDASRKAQQIIQERGYKGWEKFGVYYVEGANKVFTTLLTKNPVVGIVDQVMGDLTGVNVENTIRAGEQKWHEVTREYADNIYDLDAANAEIASKDQALRAIKKIHQQVKEGKISREEGTRRARRMMKYL